MQFAKCLSLMAAGLAIHCGGESGGGDDFGDDKLGIDPSFGSDGCITPDFPGVVGITGTLHRLDDGFVVSTGYDISKHTVTGELDTAWGNQGYLRKADISAILNSTNDLGFRGVDSQQRLYFGDPYVTCRMTPALALDTSWSDTGLTGCVYSKDGPLVEDSNGRFWQFYTNATSLYATKYNADGTVVERDIDFGTKSALVSSFRIGIPVAIQNKLFLELTHGGEDRVPHAYAMSVDIDDHSQADVSDSLLDAEAHPVTIGRTSSGRLAVEYQIKDSGSSTFKVVGPTLDVDASFHDGQPITIPDVSTYWSNMAAMADDGMLMSWSSKSPVVRISSDGDLVARYQAPEGAFVSLVNHGALSFGLLVREGLAPQVCRFATP